MAAPAARYNHRSLHFNLFISWHCLTDTVCDCDGLLKYIVAVTMTYIKVRLYYNIVLYCFRTIYQ
jgi:hypothetical protein